MVDSQETKMIDIFERLYEMDTRIERLIENAKVLADFVVSTYPCQSCKQEGPTYKDGRLVCSCGREVEV